MEIRIRTYIASHVPASRMEIPFCDSIVSIIIVVALMFKSHVDDFMHFSIWRHENGGNSQRGGQLEAGLSWREPAAASCPIGWQIQCLSCLVKHSTGIKSCS